MTEDNLKLAELLFKEELPEIAEIESKYPPRQLPEGAVVSRIAPSPTGFFHLGGVYTSQVSYKIAKQSGGVFFLRIEDTDGKRLVDGATELVINSLAEFGIIADEGVDANLKDYGNYGPYTQSQRGKIYRAYAKKLVQEGKAYACFATDAELADNAAKQTQIKAKLGYYKSWAIWRNKTLADVEAALAAGLVPAIRLRNTAESAKRKKIKDLSRGTIDFPEDDTDIVLIKGDGLPTYHFAHIIDDHLMGTTHVIRGDEWLPSMVLHVQLFEFMGWKVPVYAHIAPIQKMDGESRRKLSKRHDPEANVQFFGDAGYPVQGVKEYLLGLADSAFEPWRKANPTAEIDAYTLKVENIGKSGALLDMKKLDDVCKQYIGRIDPVLVFDEVLKWAEKYEVSFVPRLKENKEYFLKIFSIERGTANQRKDIAKWNEVSAYTAYFFEDLFAATEFDPTALVPEIPADVQKQVVVEFLKIYNAVDDKETWLANIKKMAEGMGFAPEVKLFKTEPEKWKGHFGQLTQVLRVMLTGRAQTPDLYEIMKILGEEQVRKRLQKFV